MKYLLLIAIAALVAAPAAAEQTLCYSWEDGNGTILGYWDEVVNPTNVTGAQAGSAGGAGAWTCPGAYDGDRYFHVAEHPHNGNTPQAYVAWIKNLQDNDVVYASFWAYDDIDGSPSVRIWAHYATNADVGAYKGSAGSGNNNTGYTTEVGWQEVSADWVFGVSGSPYAGYEALVIEFRLYSTPSTDPNDPPVYTTDFWGDYVCVTIPDHATVVFPDDVVPVEDSSWGTIKALYR
jgi:hypothetical protein